MPLEPQILSKMVIFSDLKSVEIKKIISILELFKVMEGETFFSINNPSDTFFIIESGTYMIHYESGQAVVLNRPGDFIGFDPILSKDRYICSGVVLKRGKLFAIKTHKFYEFLETEPSLGKKLELKFLQYTDENFKFL